MTIHYHKDMIIWHSFMLRYNDKTINYEKDMMIWQSIIMRIWWYGNLWNKITMIWSLVGYAHFAMIYFSSLAMKGYLIWFEHIKTIQYDDMKLFWCDNGVKFAGDAMALSSTTLQAGWEMWPLKMCASKNRHQFNTSNSPPW